ncbi:hypothetical protein M409DRAFT_28514 [Zasmidium cellare ATCC 36951]|uniref:Uncharacterized protein n=1 Tax=Zasmidium cellare ATCC 36951 TaxID=1080233 RepID=A0A6A6C718_ZASCE|nr:uncharacterized protein M409DRAFT_28514 [Zasmidium cellare ATCC 36951]KAF2161186.1 hypothetical protein M409DRAFT_28514 [Zasmidium cellare ATCC 36951]
MEPQAFMPMQWTTLIPGVERLHFKVCLLAPNFNPQHFLYRLNKARDNESRRDPLFDPDSRAWKPVIYEYELFTSQFAWQEQDGAITGQRNVHEIATEDNNCAARDFLLCVAEAACDVLKVATVAAEVLIKDMRLRVGAGVEDRVATVVATVAQVTGKALSDSSTLFRSSPTYRLCKT